MWAARATCARSAAASTARCRRSAARAASRSPPRRTSPGHYYVLIGSLSDMFFLICLLLFFSLRFPFMISIDITFFFILKYVSFPYASFDFVYCLGLITLFHHIFIIKLLLCFTTFYRLHIWHKYYITLLLYTRLYVDSCLISQTV